jgi:hypothetical protein
MVTTVGAVAVAGGESVSDEERRGPSEINPSEQPPSPLFGVYKARCVPEMPKLSAYVLLSV